MLFIEFHGLWDDAELCGVAIMSESQWNIHLDCAKRFFDQQSGWEVDYNGSTLMFSSYNDWADSFTTYPLTKGKLLLKDLNNGSTDPYYFGRFESPLLVYGNGALSNEDE